MHKVVKSYNPIENSFTCWQQFSVDYRIKHLPPICDPNNHSNKIIRMIIRNADLDKFRFFVNVG